MTWIERFSLFSTLDLAAFFCLFFAWIIIGHIIENPLKGRPSVSRLMVHYRREWMRNFLDRNPRVFDAQILGNLRQGTAFFASATMIAIGGGLALIGNAEQFAGVASDLTLVSAPAIVVEIKIVVMLIFVANAFLKFVWAHRLFGYCSVVMSAVPNDTNDPKALARCDTAAEINITAARSYNRAMRSVYFGLAAATWHFGAPALLVGTIITVFVLWRREFASQSRNALLREQRADGVVS
ncbi:DUF599 domain-containing protein [Shimia abyssi]|uniref:Putative membrane protein n=1 Tax=Shimia abyssi TaxID=1662395 RepID=A0A2P8FAD2_9RHOB|nr:DUF599 domain-containing protein [Shimia abyssi]PSL18648.1 putative membrane protein [Shimia abyssi]